MTRTEIVGNELAGLLGGLDANQFVSRYWGRNALFTKGRPEKVRELFGFDFDRAAFKRACEAAERDGSAGARVNAYFSVGRFLPPGQSATPGFQIRTDQMNVLASRGASILADISEPRIARFAAALKARLHFPGHVSLGAILSPAGHGVVSHIDRTSAFFIQCAGSKRWTISEKPAAAWPHGTALFREDGSAEYIRQAPELEDEIPPFDANGCKDIVMHPGDVLFLPAGTCHTTEAVTESVGVAINFEEVGTLPLITAMLERLLLPNPEWRHIPAFGNGSGTGELSPHAKAFFAERLAELRRAVEALTPDSFELNSIVQQHIANPGPFTKASLEGEAAPPQKLRPVRRTDKLAVSREFPVSHATGTDSEGGPTMRIFRLYQSLCVSGSSVAFIERLLRKKRFIAGSAVEWSDDGKKLPWKSVAALLDYLRSEGFLELQPEAAAE